MEPALEPEQKWPARLVLVRHGESQLNAAREAAKQAGAETFAGKRRDASTALTERGRRQAQCVGGVLAAERFDWFFCSPYRRCRQTAQAIREQIAAAPEVILEERLREIDFGIWEGLTRAGRMARTPDEYERFRRLGKYYYRPPGGENYPDVALRVHSFLGTLSRECRGASVLVVTHSVVVMIFRRLLERLTEAAVMRIDQDPEQEIRNCSVTEFRFDARARKLKLAKFSAIHYPESLLIASGSKE